MDTTDYFQRYQQVSSLEKSKNALIEDLLQRVTQLEEAYTKARLDCDKETRFNRDIQLHEIELMEKLSRVKEIMDREPFVVVLLDGSGLIFREEFLQQGEKGGRDAATQLSEALQRYVGKNFPGIASLKIMTKIYINTKALSDMCIRGGVLNELSLIGDFVRAFNETIPLFEIVEIGPEKDNACYKIEEILSLYLYNCHCHQVFVGCSDSGYFAIMEKIRKEGNLTGRVSVIEGIPLEQEFESIRPTFRFTKFPDIFRTKKIAPVVAPWKAAISTKPLTPSPVQHTVPLSRTSTNTTSASNGTPANVVVSSPSPKNTPFPGEFQIVRPKTSSSTRPKTVERNRYGQRVDRLDFKTIPRDDLNRIKKLKLCNFFYLQGECPNETCHHDHSRKLSKNDYFILTAIARMTPCRFGLDCDDPDCMYGHRCPQSEPGKKECYWGSNCRFDTAAHGIDTNIVKLTKV